MRPSVKKVLLLSGLFLLLLHILFICIYANPWGRGKTKADYLVGAWIYPYFHQNWTLFTPAPSCNYSLYVWSDSHPEKHDIFREILTAHRRNRFAGHEALLLAFSNSIHYFEKNCSLQQTVNGPVQGNANFDLLSHSAENYLAHTSGKSVKGIKLMLIAKDVNSGEQRIWFSR